MSDQSAKSRRVWRVGGHRALGLARGARGEDDVGEVVGTDGVGPLVRRRVRPTARQIVGQPTMPAGASPRNDDDLLERRGSGPAREERDVVVAEEAVDAEEDPSPAPAEDVRGLVTLEPGVERHEHGAGRQQAEGGDDPLLDVGCPDGDPIPRLDARRHGRTGRHLHGLAQLGKGQPHVAVDETLAGADRRAVGTNQPGNGAELEIGAGHGRTVITAVATRRRWKVASPHARCRAHAFFIQSWRSASHV